MAELRNNNHEIESADIRSALGRVTVSREFFQAVKASFPALESHPKYKPLFWYLLFGSRHDKDSHRLLLPSRFLASIDGRGSTHTQAEHFLRDFRRMILPVGTEMRWSGWSKADSKCRQLLNLDLGEFNGILNGEYQKRWNEHGRVFLDGSPFTTAKRRALRESDKGKALSERGLCDDAVSIQSYLNGLPSNQFSRIVAANHRSAIEAAASIGNLAVRTEQFRLLNAIAAQPQPFYRPSSNRNTVRLFSRNSIQNVQKNVRREICRGWHEADLQCAQLAVCARIWDALELSAFLATGDNFWRYLLNELEVPATLRPKVKKCLKKSIYSICFGMDEQYILGTTALSLARAGLDHLLARRFLAIALIRNIICDRSRAMEQLNDEKGAMTPYGKWCALSDSRNAREIMAEVAQAWEMKLIAPAFALARLTDEFSIVIYLFDGVTVSFNRREEMWKRRIKERIDGMAHNYGIYTKLQWEGEGRRETREQKSRKLLLRSTQGSFSL